MGIKEVLIRISLMALKVERFFSNVHRLFVVYLLEPSVHFTNHLLVVLFGFFSFFLF